MAEPYLGKPGYRTIKLRLGNAAPAGLSLKELHLENYDKQYGGRWDAGANKRGGGTKIGLNEYAHAISLMLKEALKA